MPRHRYYGGTIEALSARLKRKHGLSDLWVTFHVGPPAHLRLHLIRVAKDDQKQGRADAALIELCAYADERGYVFALSPTAEFGASKARLSKWYRRHGFLPNAGSRKDFRINESKIRLPFFKS